MSLNPGGVARVTWGEWPVGRDTADIPLTEVPPFLDWDHTYKRAGTYLVVVSQLDVGGRLANQNAIVFYLSQRVGAGASTSLELWRRRWYGTTSAVQASFSGLTAHLVLA